MEKDKDKIINVPIEDILPNRFQPRLAFDEKELNELSNSILKYGVIQPVILRRIGDKYEIIAGERRYKATVLAGLKTIPAIINDTDDNTSAEIALLENLQRKNLTVIEEAQSFKKLLQRGFTQEEIASKMGVSQSSIANKLRLLNLPRKVQDALLFNKISERHARSLISLNDKEKQEKLLDRIINEKLTVKQTEDEISKILNNFNDEDDIPLEIRKFINRDEKLEDSDKKNNIESNDLKDSQTNNDKKYINDINPFQYSFQDSIRKIEESIDDKEESFYDKIINNDLKSSNLTYDDRKKEEIDNQFDNLLNNKPTVTNVVSKVRNFVKNFDDIEVIDTKEIDMPDKYQIIIEIKK